MRSKLQDLKELQKGSPLRASAGLADGPDAYKSADHTDPQDWGVQFSNPIAAELDAVLRRRHDQLLNRLDRQEDSLKMILAATADYNTEARGLAAKQIIQNARSRKSSIFGVEEPDRASGLPARLSFRFSANEGASMQETPARRHQSSIQMIAKASLLSAKLQQDQISPKREAPVWRSSASGAKDLAKQPAQGDIVEVGTGFEEAIQRADAKVNAQEVGHSSENGALEQAEIAQVGIASSKPQGKEEVKEQTKEESRVSMASRVSAVSDPRRPSRVSQSEDDEAIIGQKQSFKRRTSTNMSALFGDPALKALARVSNAFNKDNPSKINKRTSQWSTDSDEDRMRKSAAQEIQEIHHSEEADSQPRIYWLPFRAEVQRLTSSFRFEIFFAVLIITNSVYVGIQVEYNVSTAYNNGGPSPLVFYVVGYSYTIAFLIELLLRVYGEGPLFFCSRNWTWNYLDIVIVTSSCMEVVLDIVKLGESEEDTEESGTGGLTNVRILRMLRITRLTRVLRIVRIVRFIRALRTLVYSIISTLKSLVWAMMLLVIIIYVFGILFTQGVNDYLIEQEALHGDEEDTSCDDARVVLKRYYGSLPKSMYTLFKAVAGGISWDVVVEPLGDASPIFVAFFTAFIAFVYFAVLNVVTGVFCQSAIESAAHDADMVVHAQLANKKMYVDKVKALFMDIDADNSGFITINEFEKYLRKDETQAYFGSLELDYNDAWTLFKLLDADESNVVDVEEFVTGCLRLKGGAKAIDIAQLMFESKSIGRRLANFMRYVENEFQTFGDMADLIRLITQHSRECPLLLPMMQLSAGTDLSIESADTAPETIEGTTTTGLAKGQSQASMHSCSTHGGHGHGHGHAHHHGHSHNSLGTGPGVD